MTITVKKSKPLKPEVKTDLVTRSGKRLQLFKAYEDKIKYLILMRMIRAIKQDNH